MAEAINFFIFDTIKIFILLAVIIFIVSILRSFIPPKKIRKILSHKYQFTGNFLAAAFGIVTPFCTCSAIPLFLGFIEAGVPLGVTFSFLIASPMINEIAIALLFGLFGWKISLTYIISGYLIAVISGLIIGKLKVENLTKNIVQQDTKNLSLNFLKPTWTQRLNFAKNYTVKIILKVGPYVIIGIGVGAWIHGYVPTNFMVKYAGGNSWYAVPIATLIGIPLYSNAAGILPLASVLTEKGVSIGTTLAFMMAVTGLSLPEFLMLKKVIKTKLIIIFASIVGIGIILTGYLFNFLLK
ncbi:MAG: permease [Candidatus Babeliales bacterium]